MNKQLKKCLALLAAALTASTACAYDFEGGGIYFNITGSDTHEVAVAPPGAAEVYSGVVILPTTVNYNGSNYAVTSIAPKAFFRSAVTEVVIPNSVTAIGDHAFAGSQQLRSITLPLGLKTVPPSMLAETAIEAIALPEGVDSIGDQAFYSCMQLQSVFLPASLTGIGDRAFANCGNLYEIFSAADTCACRISPTAFELSADADFTLPDSGTAQAFAADTALNTNGNLHYYSFDGQEVTLSMTPDSQDFGSDMVRVALAGNFGYRIFDEDNELVAVTAADGCYLPRLRQDATYTIVPTNLIADGEPMTVTVEANQTTGITTAVEEAEHPTIHVIDGTIYISGDNYGKWTYVYDAYGNLYYQRPAVNNIIGDLPRNRVYIVRVGNYTKKIFL